MTQLTFASMYSSDFRINTRISLRLKILLFGVLLIGQISVFASTEVCTGEGEISCNNGIGCYQETDRCDGFPDCTDRTDEEGCAKTCDAGEFLCDEEDCYPDSYKCDGHSDCSDNSDEQSCDNVTCSLEGEFMCKSDKTCIVGAHKCDGTPHCHDGSDEEGCESSPIVHDPCDPVHHFDCTGDGTHCVALSKLCDGHDDCENGADERDPSCVTTNSSTGSRCAANNGGCSHDCIETADGYHCDCPSGYELGHDHTTCEDIDQCESHACSHECVDHEGTYECLCYDGYQLSDDDHTCLASGEEPELWITNGSYLVQYWLNSHDREITNLGGNLHSIAYDYKNGKIFWIDSQKNIIYSANKNSTGQPEVLVDTVKEWPIALAFDWIHNNLYWADMGRHVTKIEVISLEQKWRTVVVSPPEVEHPKFVVVDPRQGQGYLYWAQGGTNGVIRKAELDGSSPESIVTVDIDNVQGMALDLVDNRLFWIDRKLNILESIGLAENDREILATFDEYPTKHLIGISVFEDSVYWGDHETKSVSKVYKYLVQDQDKPQVTGVIDQILNLQAIEIYHKMKQPQGENYCGDNNGGCSHICLPSPHYIQSRCFCPLSTDKTHHYVQDSNDSSICHLIDSVSSSSTVAKLENTTAKLVAATSSPSVRSPTNFISKSFLSTAAKPHMTTEMSHGIDHDQATSDDLEGNKSGEEKRDNMWLYIGIGGIAGLLVILLLSFIGYKLYARHVAKNLHFDNPVFEQKPLRNSHRQGDSRA